MPITVRESQEPGDGAAATTPRSFLTDIAALRERARSHIAEGAVTPGYGADRSHSEYVEGSSLADMVREDLIAERIAIESYTAMIRYIGEGDPTTRRMLEGILAVEEEHAEELASMLATLSGNRA